MAEMDRCCFSTYGVYIEHPLDWRIFLDPKKGFNRQTGFIRIEDYVPKKGAQVSMSVNWARADSDSDSFPETYYQNLQSQYGRQLKKAPHKIESMEIIHQNGQKAAYIVSGYWGAQKLFHKGDEQIKALQLAFYDDGSSRAVVGTVMGHIAAVEEQEPYLKELLLTLKCI